MLLDLYQSTLPEMEGALADKQPLILFDLHERVIQFQGKYQASNSADNILLKNKTHFQLRIAPIPRKKSRDPRNKTDAVFNQKYMDAPTECYFTTFVPLVTAI